MGTRRSSTRTDDLLSIGEAATILEVCEMTLRRWDRAGKFSPRRHPMNGYRMYRRSEVMALRRAIKSGVAA